MSAVSAVEMTLQIASAVPERKHFEPNKIFTPVPLTQCVLERREV